MKLHRLKIGRKNLILYYSCTDNIEAPQMVTDTWNKNMFLFPQSHDNKTTGFRIAQLGAIYAIKSHWTISVNPATIVMPTGTGKTEVMIATVISEQCKKTCIIVPSNLLRKQTAKRFCTLEKLREIGAITDKFKNPTVGVIISTPKSSDELNELVTKSNVIITTMALLCQNEFKSKYLATFVSMCDTVIIDEAHHIPANSWSKIKKSFFQAKCLQFTATPFRNDGKRIDGNIIYNYPLSQAQKEGYFKPINFFPILEFDTEVKDYSVAKKAVELLEHDIKSGLSHLLLVRTSSQQRAKDLYENIYKKYYNQYSPVLIVSSNKRAENKSALKSVKDGVAKIIVCVDMFSEGIDIPQLKVCAIHDKYKSLPITLQFIGRFARSQQNLGDASVVANIVDDDIHESIEELYSQDTDWNYVLRNVSDNLVKREVDLQKLAGGFMGTESIPISQIRPKISMFMYTTEAKNWHWNKWKDIFDEDYSHHFVNEEEKILIITELNSTRVEWTSNKDISDKIWNLHILYWNEDKHIFFVNTTDKGVANRFAQAIMGECKLVNGEDVFRCLYGIHRLMLSTVGLKTAISNHHIRYRMFAGIDVEEGINNAVTGTSTKSNLFGIGYEEGKHISIGCSYKGTIWSKWVETIDYWLDWCNKQADKILNTNIDTSQILANALVPQEITHRPSVVPYRIDFPLDVNVNYNFLIATPSAKYNPDTFDICLTTFDETSPLSFYFGNDTVKEEFILDVTETNYTISHKSGTILSICFGQKKEMHLKDYFQDNPPIIWFVDGSSLEGNLIVRLKESLPITFSKECIIPWDWTGIDIKIESQGVEKIQNSIQYHVIDIIKKSTEHCIIFDDDGAGEIADVVAIQEDSVLKKIHVDLYHCKYSHGVEAGSRVIDLYEVCGQAEKCIKWANNPKSMFERLFKREQSSKRSRNVSRFEIGNEKVLFNLKSKLKFYTTTFDVYIVQPGVDSKKITSSMHQVLCSAQAYLHDTYSISLKLICS